MSAVPPAFSLTALNDDLLMVLGTELCDPLQPKVAVYLSSTAKSLRALLWALLLELEPRHEEVRRLAKQLRGAEDLDVGRLAAAHCRILGEHTRKHTLHTLRHFSIWIGFDGDEGLALFAAGLQSGCLPSLRSLTLGHDAFNPLHPRPASARLTNRCATALAAALTQRALPSLVSLDLSSNSIRDAELATLAPALRQLPTLKMLQLVNNEISDEGLASLFVEPAAGALPSLMDLRLGFNPITDDGLASLLAAPLDSLTDLDLNGTEITEVGIAGLCAAMAGGALPSFRNLWLDGTQGVELPARLHVFCLFR